ncbi:MAG: hypothetical protein ACHQ5A_13935, partial [Opitutales bacterium]
MFFSLLPLRPPRLRGNFSNNLPFACYPQDACHYSSQGVNPPVSTDERARVAPNVSASATSGFDFVLRRVLLRAVSASFYEKAVSVKRKLRVLAGVELRSSSLLLKLPSISSHSPFSVVLS